MGIIIYHAGVCQHRFAKMWLNRTMIATLRGEVSQIEENAIIVEVGGVGLRVFVPALLRGRLKAGDVILLYTHLIVRQDALTLYGFESQSDRELFNMLSGCGRRGAEGGAFGSIHADIGCRTTRGLHRRAGTPKPCSRRRQEDIAKDRPLLA